ncbi:hypothetical protein DVH24_027401 [Malus domestica]|uniref:Uncharacterized protein n=1 Tax=Malus domestica TaxID=3750 RepID=A0A498HDQ8_MALDO|nr:hypothetical protein DVH24_027401 [Malus domestica]
MKFSPFWLNFNTFSNFKNWGLGFQLNFDFPKQILCAYFVVLPLRDEGAISLGLSSLPSLFVGSWTFTCIAAPVATLIFSLPNVSKGKAKF